MILTKGQRNNLAKKISNGNIHDHRDGMMQPLRNLLVTHESAVSANYKKILAFLQSEPGLVRIGKIPDIVRRISEII